MPFHRGLSKAPEAENKGVATAERRPETTHTDRGNDFAQFLARTKAAMKEHRKVVISLYHVVSEQVFFLNNQRCRKRANTPRNS